MKRKNLLYIIPLVLVATASYLLMHKNDGWVVLENVPIGQFQVAEVFAKNGYSPTKIQANANVPTILKIKTENTLDCSGSVVIPELDFQEFLPVTGITEIQILPQESGETIAASCTAGQYGFEIRFV